jgi:murein DD-endopeptidase MepM/ murein hydrolase activator NlpD
VALTSRSSKVRGLIPLHGLQLLCCAVIAGLGLQASAHLARHSDKTRIALDAFVARQIEESAAAATGSGFAEAVQIIVKRNDTLDQIFRRMQLSLADLADIRALDMAREALDRIRPGDMLTVFTRDDQIVGLERPLSLEQTLKIERDASDAFTASVESVPLNRHLVTASGTIRSNLFAAGYAAGLHDAVLWQVEDIFRWDVDFMLDLRVNDSFTLVYEQLEKDGQIVGDGEVLAAEFVNQGTRFRAVRYENAAGEVAYYTPEGVPLRKAFLKAPVQFTRISSVFNPNRKHPVLNTIRAHRGVDYAAPSGTKIYAAGAGRVKFVGVKGGFGNLVELSHANGIVTRYGHMSRFAKGIKAGQRVEQGDLIGYVGMTGLATGPHLHFEFIDNGVTIDPQKALRRSKPGEPVPADERARFELVAAPLLARLDAGSAPAAVIALAAP